MRVRRLGTGVEVGAGASGNSSTFEVMPLVAWVAEASTRLVRGLGSSVEA